MRSAVVQMNSQGSRDHNVDRALRLVDQAVGQGAEFVVLPEYMTFLGPYERFEDMSEPIPGPTYERLSAKARQHRIYLHGGSLIEKSSRPGRFHNTSLLFDPQGKLIALYRKIHLFDVDIPDGVTDTESSVILAGDTLVTTDVSGFKVGMSICYDLRFPEMYRQLAAAGSEVIVIPSAFTKVTGQAHWQTLLRARAIENLAYVLAAAQHGQGASGNWCYGHSMIVDPWGEILAMAAPEGNQVLVADLDRNEVVRRREQMPVLNVRRPDVYDLPVVNSNLVAPTYLQPPD